MPWELERLKAPKVNQVVAQSKTIRRLVDRLHTHRFDFWQGRCHRFGCPRRRRSLRMCRKRPCRSRASEQTDELPPHGSSIGAPRLASRSRPGVQVQKSPAVAGLVGHAKAGIEHIPPSTLLEPNPGLLSSRYPTQGLSGCVEPSGDAARSSRPGCAGGRA